MFKVAAFLCTFVISGWALIRPSTPTNVDASFIGNTIRISANVTGDSYDSCHAVLLTDLTASLENAFQSGNKTGEGAVLAYSSKQFPMTITIKNEIRERYFVAVATSKKDSNGITIRSGWKLFNTDGLPTPVTTADGEKIENLMCRARTVNAGNLDQAVIDITFSLPSSSSSKYTFELRNKGSSLFSIKLDTVIARTIRDAINNNSTLPLNHLLLKTSGSGQNLFTFYFYKNNFTDNDSIYACLINDSNRVVANRQVSKSSSVAGMDIVNTIYTLMRIHETVADPIFAGSVTGTFTDSSKIRLYITALTDLALAHNSPAQNADEARAGIFTNYIQFMDNVARHWSNIKNGGTGFKRLQNIDTLILGTNANTKGIADPIYVKNNGTLAEYGVTEPEQKRKNYTFYEGYSRLAIEMDRPTYGSNEPTGAGLMFRISDNIELYFANLADTFNMFDSAIINGQKGRRIIVSAKDSLLEKIDSSGLWVKGIDESKGEANWYTGVVAVRLPLQAVSNVEIDSVFSISGEGLQDGDPVGKIVGGADKSILKMMPIVIDENGNRVEIGEAEKSTMMIHGGIRKVTYSSDYIGGNVKYSLNGDSTTRSKVTFTVNGNSAIIEDTALFSNLSILSLVYYGNTLVFAAVKKTSSKHLCFKDADLKGKCEILSDGKTAIPITIEDVSENWLKPDKDEKSQITVKWDNGLKVYKNSNINDDNNLLWPTKDKKEESGTFLYDDWNKFKENVLEKYRTLYVVCPNKGKSQLFIKPDFEMHTQSEYNTEMVCAFTPYFSIKDNRGIEAAMSEFPIDLKQFSPVYITLGGYSSENNDYIREITLTINYDLNNSDHVNFYGANRVVKTIRNNYTSLQDEYTFQWDGRDDIDNRILLGGKFTLNAVIITNQNKTVTISTSFSSEKPTVISLGVDYPVNANAQHDINLFRQFNANHDLDWSAVPFFNNTKYYDFNWFSNFSKVQNVAIQMNGYNTIEENGTAGSEEIIEDLKNRGAGLRFFGHHTISRLTNPTRDIGNVILNNERLLADCDDQLVGYCTDAEHTHCINIDCESNSRGDNYLEDVLFAALIGCRTGVGNISTAQALIDKGVDCVLATKRKVPVIMMVLFNRYFWDYCNDRTINDAAKAAYDEALSTLNNFFNNIGIDKVREKFRTDENGEPYLNTYDNTFQFLNDPDNGTVTNLLPARFGKKNR